MILLSNQQPKVPPRRLLPALQVIITTLRNNRQPPRLPEVILPEVTSLELIQVARNKAVQATSPEVMPRHHLRQRKHIITITTTIQQNLPRSQQHTSQQQQHIKQQPHRKQQQHINQQQQHIKQQPHIKQLLHINQQQQQQQQHINQRQQLLHINQQQQHINQRQQHRKQQQQQKVSKICRRSMFMYVFG